MVAAQNDSQHQSDEIVVVRESIHQTQAETTGDELHLSLVRVLKIAAADLPSHQSRHVDPTRRIPARVDRQQPHTMPTSPQCLFRSATLRPVQLLLRCDQSPRASRRSIPATKITFALAATTKCKRHCRPTQIVGDAINELGESSGRLTSIEWTNRKSMTQNNCRKIDMSSRGRTKYRVSVKSPD